MQMKKKEKLRIPLKKKNNKQENELKKNLNKVGLKALDAELKKDAKIAKDKGLSLEQIENNRANTLRTFGGLDASGKKTNEQSQTMAFVMGQKKAAQKGDKAA